MMRLILWTSRLVPSVLEVLPVLGLKVNRQGETLLLDVCKRGWSREIQLLFSAGADVNTKDKHGHTALSEVASRGIAELVKTLLAAGADVNSKDNDGRSVLMGAVCQNAEVVKLLLSTGADVNANSDSGSTALMLAAQIRRHSRLLLSFHTSGRVTKLLVIPRRLRR